MRAKFWIIGGSLLGLTLLASPGIGILANPTKAKKFQSTLTAGYVQCTAPNTTTVGIGLMACQPAVLSDGHCSISPDGGGKLQAKQDGGDLAIKAKLKGIQGCDGEQLCVVASTRVSSKNCVVVDLTDFPLNSGPTPACCVVDKGKCKIKTSLNAALVVPALGMGQNTSFDIRGCGLSRFTGTSAGQVARCGVVIP
jgi:hypothetical protein